MALFERAKKILLQPKQEWEVISGESTSTAGLYTGYVIPLAAIGPVCSVIGLSVVGISLPMVGTYRVPIMSSILSAVVQYALALAAVYILAIVIDNITPKFEGLRDMGAGAQAGGLFFNRLLARRDFHPDPGAGNPGSGRALQHLPALRRDADTYEGAQGKSSDIHGRGDRCRYCHLCRDKHDNARAHTPSDTRVTSGQAVPSQGRVLSSR